MPDIELFENAAKEYLRDAKDAFDDGDFDLCITFLDMARDEILGLVDAAQQTGAGGLAAGQSENQGQAEAANR
jgi:hypothetical protein